MVFMVVTIKNVVFWVVTLCSPRKNQRFGGTYRLNHQGENNQLNRTVSYC
jgi:hypothetical protein